MNGRAYDRMDASAEAAFLLIAQATAVSDLMGSAKTDDLHPHTLTNASELLSDLLDKIKGELGTVREFAALGARSVDAAADQSAVAP